MIVDFTGMDIANASLLDEGTAAAEAMGLSHRLNKSDSNLVFVSENCHPQTIDVIQTRAEPMGLKVLVGNEDKVLEQLKEDIVCGVLQYPGTLGDIKDPSEAISKIHKKNGKAILVCDLLALSMLKTPRELGADIAVGSSQRFGIPMGYGGPHAAFLQQKMNTNDLCQVGLLGFQWTGMETKPIDCHYKLESNILEETKLQVIFVPVSYTHLTLPTTLVV